MFSTTSKPESSSRAPSCISSAVSSMLSSGLTSGTATDDGTSGTILLTIIPLVLKQIVPGWCLWCWNRWCIWCNYWQWCLWCYKGSASGAGIDGACSTITDDDASGVGIDGTSDITTDDDLVINLGHQAVSDLQKGTPWIHRYITWQATSSLIIPLLLFLGFTAFSTSSSETLRSLTIASVSTPSQLESSIWLLNYSGHNKKLWGGNLMGVRFWCFS